jgi:hypothetical protein
VDTEDLGPVCEREHCMKRPAETHSRWWRSDR